MIKTFTDPYKYTKRSEHSLTQNIAVTAINIIKNRRIYNFNRLLETMDIAKYFK